MDLHVLLSVDSAVMAKLDMFAQVLTRIDAAQQQLNHKVKLIMASLADIQAQNTALSAAVAAEDTVIDSAVVLINGFNGKLADLSAQLAAAIASNNPTAIQAVVDAMTATTADLTAKTAALAASVAAGTGTPPAPITVPVGPTPPA